jgi:hypothetical protein
MDEKGEGVTKNMSPQSPPFLWGWGGAWLGMEIATGHF